jgi:hypothetical protein
MAIAIPLSGGVAALAAWAMGPVPGWVAAAVGVVIGVGITTLVLVIARRRDARRRLLL